MMVTSRFLRGDIEFRRFDAVEKLRKVEAKDAVKPMEVASKTLKWKRAAV
jgi:hypothetical protein